VDGGDMMRGFFFSLKDNMLVKAPFPQWMDKEHNAKKADLLSRPMRYHSAQKKAEMIGQRKPAKKKVVNDEQ